MTKRDNGKAETFLQDMSDEALKQLYHMTEEWDKVGQEFMKRYGNKDSYELTWKSPYLHIQITCKDILGERAIK